MATATLQHSRTRASMPVRTSEPKTMGPLLVATDGTVRSDAALRAALKISSSNAQKVLVLAVHAPLPAMGPEVLIATSPDTESSSRAALLCQVVEQIERVGITDPWPVKVTTGYPAATIVGLAKNIDASLIVMGLGGHGVLDRLFGEELALQVLRVGTVPVLAVAEDFQDLPERVVAAVDFSESSRRALALGGPLVRAGGKVTLAHVITSETDPLNWLAMDPPRVGSIGRKLDQLGATIEFRDGVMRERRVVAGDPGKQLLEIVADMHADLIVTGSHGHNFLNRLLLGSVSTQLLRKAGCSILVAPPLDAPELIEEPEPRTRFAFYEWTERLEEFTRRNLWRRARLEILDPEIGAQLMEVDVRFMGASFDPRTSHVHLMFGSRDGRTGHVTHNIEGVTGIRTVRARDGVDVLLRVGHGSGQTLLTLER